MRYKELKINQSNSKNMLNLGCGSRFHPEFTNVDLNSIAPYVQSWDLRQSLPFSNNTFDVVYHSHLLEHFDRGDATKLLLECYRVCKPNGILRVVVPDLENIVRLYLHFHDQAQADVPGADHNYQWMMLELYDQAVRKTSGGEMVHFLRNLPPESVDFVKNRIGSSLFEAITKSNVKKPLSKRLEKISIKLVIEQIRIRLLRMLVFFMLGKNGAQLVNEVMFRAKGEIHQWMYDYYSLKNILVKIGFVNINKLSAKESSIEGWEKLYLDSEPDGSVYKPDSLFCEAIKPAVIF